jgi:anti-sigma factor RsiW
MMTCQQLTELLLEFIAGELEATHAAAIQEHLDGCNACVAFVHSYRVTITLTRKLPTLPMRRDFAQRLEVMLRELEQSNG